MESVNFHNYYEKLVLEHILEATGSSVIDSYIEDIACLALNQLPPRYVRHDIDMAFYLSSDERQTIERHIDIAVAKAIRHIALNRKSA